jgi:hypothetical protein
LHTKHTHTHTHTHKMEDDRNRKKEYYRRKLHASGCVCVCVRRTAEHLARGERGRRRRRRCARQPIQCARRVSPLIATALRFARLVVVIVIIVVVVAFVVVVVVVVLVVGFLDRFRRRQRRRRRRSVSGGGRCSARSDIARVGGGGLLRCRIDIAAHRPRWLIDFVERSHIDYDARTDRFVTQPTEAKSICDSIRLWHLLQRAQKSSRERSTQAVRCIATEHKESTVHSLSDKRATNVLTCCAAFGANMQRIVHDGASSVDTAQARITQCANNWANEQSRRKPALSSEPNSLSANVSIPKRGHCTYIGISDSIVYI